MGAQPRSLHKSRLTCLPYLCAQVRVGWALAHRHGGATAHALCELWLSEVMPALVVRE